jgi:cytochrome P450
LIEINQRSRHVRLNPKEPEFYKNPYPLYDLIREQVPVFFWEDYQMWCFAAHADVNAILRDRRFGRQITHLDRKIKLPKVSPELQPLKDVDKYSMLEMEPPAHTRLRGLVHKAFMARQIEQMRPRIERLCHELIDRMIARGPGDLLDIYAVPIPVIIIAEMLGVPTEMADQLLDWSHAIVKTYQIGHTEEESALALQAAIDFTDYLKELVVERRSNPKDDLITRLIEVRDAGEKLTEKELISNCILLLNAGHEATVNLTGNGVYALLSNPEQLADLKSDPAIIPTAIEELFRFDTPLHYFERWVLEDLEIAGQKFPFGSKIAVLLGAANRDPAVFPEPNRLLLRRANNLHVSFGGGIHYCLGAPLARLELNISIPLLFERLPNLSLMEEPVFMNSYHFRGLETLKVDW